ncbi:MAG: OmpA family protein [Myxococcaceae bacterium]|nr:OmpA family protein [Myxococcaceae bacterium]
MKKLIIGLSVVVVAACATAPKPQPEPEKKDPAPAQPAKAAEPEKKADVKDDIEALINGFAIHFEFDKAELTPDSQKRLDVLAEKMRANPAVHIKVAGNADELGTEEYNLALGQKRADAVKTYLSRLGVDAKRVDTVSYGEEKPLDPNHTPEAWSKNRRGDIEKK